MMEPSNLLLTYFLTVGVIVSSVADLASLGVQNGPWFSNIEFILFLLLDSFITILTCVLLNYTLMGLETCPLTLTAKLI